MKLLCQKCGSRRVRRSVEESYENNVKSLKITITCEVCGQVESQKIRATPQSPATMIDLLKRRLKRAPPEEVGEEIVRAPAKEHLKSRLKRYDEERVVEASKDELMDREFVLTSEQVKDVFVYVLAIIAGIGVEFGGFGLERLMISLNFPAAFGFKLSFIFFVFCPVLVTGSIVYFFTRDKLKAIVMGALVIPVFLIILRRFILFVP
jgi:hypothetical protein